MGIENIGSKISDLLDATSKCKGNATPRVYRKLLRKGYEIASEVRGDMPPNTTQQLVEGYAIAHPSNAEEEDLLLAELVIMLGKSR